MSLPDNFWSFNVGHVGTILTFVISMTVGWTTLNNSQIQLRKDHDTLLIRVEQMDQHGTRSLQADTLMEISNERRISAMEANWNTALPKIERIDTNVLWLMKGERLPQAK